ncbi:hypothetical protein N9F42_01880 [Pseudomonadales bacterium]|nr:hypothetical protein [Pseudomonadales bacterium]
MHLSREMEYGLGVSLQLHLGGSFSAHGSESSGVGASNIGDYCAF